MPDWPNLGARFRRGPGEQVVTVAPRTSCRSPCGSTDYGRLDRSVQHYAPEGAAFNAAEMDAAPRGLDLGANAWWLSLGFLAGTMAVAVLRHRLYGLDVYVNRGLVYTGVTVLLGGLYVATVLGLGHLLYAAYYSLLGLVAPFSLCIVGAASIAAPALVASIALRPPARARGSSGRTPHL